MTDAEQERVDALYALPPERFVADRDALAKALRAEGDRDGAQAVKALRKPTRAAWAVNAAVREDPGAARALIDAARLLREAQEELLAGGDASALREATARAREAADALLAAAPVDDAPTVEKVRATLQAATVAPEVLAEATSGRLVHERVASGFGALAGAGTEAGTGRVPRARRSPARETALPQPAEKERAAAREEERRRERIRRAKEEEAAAATAVEAARRALEQVEAALSDRRAQLREAQTRLRDARRRRERAEGS